MTDTTLASAAAPRAIASHVRTAKASLLLQQTQQRHKTNGKDGSWLAAATHAGATQQQQQNDVTSNKPRVRCVVQRTMVVGDDDDATTATTANEQQQQLQQLQQCAQTAAVGRRAHADVDVSRGSRGALTHASSASLTASRAAAIAATSSRASLAQRRSLSCLVAALHKTSSSGGGGGGNGVAARPQRRQWLSSKSAVYDRHNGSGSNTAAAATAAAVRLRSRNTTTATTMTTTAAVAATTTAAQPSAPPGAQTTTTTTTTTTVTTGANVYVAPRHHLRSRVSNASSRRARVVVNVYLSKYALVRRVAKELDYDVQTTEESLDAYAFNLCWSDTVLPLTRLVRLGNWQRTNHFPAMYVLCRKSHLGRTLGVLRRLLPPHFAFYPRTWMMRCERAHFEVYWNAMQQRRQRRTARSATATATATTTTMATTATTTTQEQGQEQTSSTAVARRRHRTITSGSGGGGGGPFFILKPNAGCQGRGIVVTRDPLHAVDDLDNYIVQEYIARPMLIDGCKFDLRVYVLLTSIREPSIFLFDDGLVRMCTNAYAEPSDDNVHDSCMHLTNYAINKRSDHYVYNDDAERFDIGNKRNFRFFDQWLRDVQQRDVAVFWSQVAAIVVKTILAAQPQISHVYNTCFPSANEGYTCFELLGFDILVDSKARPWLMEVNHTPSLATDTPLDYDIKSKLVREVWRIVGCAADDQQRDCARVRAQFTLRNIPPWVAAQDAAAAARASRNSNNNNNNAAAAATAAATTAGGESSHGSASRGVLSSYESALQEDVHGVPRYVQERRAREDGNLCHFTRIYPSSDAAQQRIYDDVRATAKACCTWQEKLPTLRTNSSDMGHYFSYYYYNNNNNNNGGSNNGNSATLTASGSGGAVAAMASNNSNVSSPLRGSVKASGSAGTGAAAAAAAAATTSSSSTATANGNDVTPRAGNNSNNGNGAQTTLLMYTHQLLQDHLRRDRNRPRGPTYKHSVASAAASSPSSSSSSSTTTTPRNDAASQSPSPPTTPTRALRASTHEALTYQAVGAEMQRLRKRTQQSTERQREQQQRRDSNAATAAASDDEAAQHDAVAAAAVVVANVADDATCTRGKSPPPLLQPPPPLASPRTSPPTTTTTAATATVATDGSTQHNNNNSGTGVATHGDTAAVLHSRTGSDAVAAVVAAAPRTRSLPSPDTATMTLTDEEVRWLNDLQHTLDIAAAADPEPNLDDTVVMTGEEEEEE